MSLHTNLNQERKNKYRSKIQILTEILQYTKDGDRDGVLVSVISRKANLSHAKALHDLKAMAESGLIKINQSDSKRSYNITENGLMFLNEIECFHTSAKEIKLLE
jgi:predicted transcriptional regulator